MVKKAKKRVDIGSDNPFETPLSVVEYIKERVEESVDNLAQELDELDSGVVEARAFLEDAESRLEERDLTEAIDFILRASEIAGKLSSKALTEDDVYGVVDDLNDEPFPSDE